MRPPITHALVNVLKRDICTTIACNNVHMKLHRNKRQNLAILIINAFPIVLARGISITIVPIDALIELFHFSAPSLSLLWNGRISDRPYRLSTYGLNIYCKKIKSFLFKHKHHYLSIVNFELSMRLAPSWCGICSRKAA